MARLCLDCDGICEGARCKPCRLAQGRQRDAKRGSARQRGYDSAHERLRAAWAPRVDAGTVDCHATQCLQPTRRIKPGTRWDLGHTEDRTTWTGPEHAVCNRADGGRRSHAVGPN